MSVSRGSSGWRETRRMKNQHEVMFTIVRRRQTYGQGGQRLGLEKVMKDGRQEEKKKRLIRD